jgi:hypothetical protein
VILSIRIENWESIYTGKGADAKPNPPGMFCFQPGGSAATAHGDECLSNGCTLFLYMPGKFEFTVVPPAKK